MKRCSNSSRGNLLICPITFLTCLTTNNLGILKKKGFKRVSNLSWGNCISWMLVIYSYLSLTNLKFLHWMLTSVHFLLLKLEPWQKEDFGKQNLYSSISEVLKLSSMTIIKKNSETIEGMEILKLNFSCFSLSLWNTSVEYGWVEKFNTCNLPTIVRIHLEGPNGPSWVHELSLWNNESCSCIYLKVLHIFYL